MIEDLDSLDCSEEKEDTTCMTVPYVKVYKLKVQWVCLKCRHPFI